METHRPNSSSVRSVAQRHPTTQMILVLGWLLVFASPTLASHGTAHLGPMEFGDWESYFDSSHAEHPASSVQAKNPFTPYLPGVSRLDLHKAGLHCLLSASIHPGSTRSKGPVCRLFSEPGGDNDSASITQEWNLFRLELAAGQTRFFKTPIFPAFGFDLNTLTGYLLDTYGVSRLRGSPVHHNE